VYDITLVYYVRVSQIFQNQKNLEQEARNLSMQTARYSKQTAQWLALVEQFDSALKVLIGGHESASAIHLTGYWDKFAVTEHLPLSQSFGNNTSTLGSIATYRNSGMSTTGYE
jgi:hypothetical protein